MTAGIVVLIIILVLAVIILAKSATVIRQAEKGLVERFGPLYFLAKCYL